MYNYTTKERYGILQWMTSLCVTSHTYSIKMNLCHLLYQYGYYLSEQSHQVLIYSYYKATTNTIKLTDCSSAFALTLINSWEKQVRSLRGQLMGPERRGDIFQLDQVKGMNRVDMSRKLQHITGQRWTPWPLLRQTYRTARGTRETILHPAWPLIQLPKTHSINMGENKDLLRFYRGLGM